MGMKLYIGTSGYDYLHWGNGVFYRKEIVPAQWLEFYSQQFNAVELNSTFQQTPDTATAMAWIKATPREFRFTVKGPRFITHIKRLKDVSEPLLDLGESLNALRPRTACFLWQLPEELKKDHPRLSHFCGLLHKTKFLRDVRHAFEFRDASWFCEDIYRILKEHRFCLCFPDSLEKSREWAITTDFIYLRFHGGKAFYNSHYSRHELEQWADKVRTLRDRAQTIYAFFSNDEQGFAVYNAQSFRMLLLERRMI